MTDRSASIASSLGVVFVILFSLEMSLSLGLENCTQGDTDGYIGGLILAAPLALAAVGAFWMSRHAASRIGWVRSGIVAIVGLALSLELVPWVIATTLAGHHPCGADYNAYRLTGRAIDRWVPLLDLLLVLAVAFSATLPLWWQRQAQPPNN